MDDRDSSPSSGSTQLAYQHVVLVPAEISDRAVDTSGCFSLAQAFCLSGSSEDSPRCSVLSFMFYCLFRIATKRKFILSIQAASRSPRSRLLLATDRGH